MKLYIEPCYAYPLHELDITDWLAKENGFDSQGTGMIDIIQETSDVYCIVINDGTGSSFKSIQHWLPRSQCKIVERTGPKK